MSKSVFNIVMALTADDTDGHVCLSEEAVGGSELQRKLDGGGVDDVVADSSAAAGLVAKEATDSDEEEKKKSVGKRKRRSGRRCSPRQGNSLPARLK